MSTNFYNQYYANLGNVTVFFSDSTYVTHNISSLGTTNFNNSDPSKTPVSVNALGVNFLLSDMPTPVTYPDSFVGQISYGVLNNRLPAYSLWMNGL